MGYIFSRMFGYILVHAVLFLFTTNFGRALMVGGLGTLIALRIFD